MQSNIFMDELRSKFLEKYIKLSILKETLSPAATCRSTQKKMQMTVCDKKCYHTKSI